jgi:hypothetical protein
MKKGDCRLRSHVINNIEVPLKLERVLIRIILIIKGCECPAKVTLVKPSGKKVYQF